CPRRWRPASRSSTAACATSRPCWNSSRSSAGSSPRNWSSRWPATASSSRPLPTVEAGGGRPGQNGSASSGSSASSRCRNSPWMRSSAAWSSASKRSTSTGVVLDARTRPQPSGQSTRSPSMVDRRAPLESAAATKRSTKPGGSSPGATTLISGGGIPAGSAASTSPGASRRAGRGAAEVGGGDEAFDEAVRVLPGRDDLDLRRRDPGGQRRQHLAGSLRPGREDLQQPRGGVDAVVEAVPALLEEEVPAHLAGQFGA